MKRMIPLILPLATMVLLSGCDVSAIFGQDKWEGFVYPDASNLTVHRSSGIHDSLEACRAASINMLNRISSLERGGYECGSNCESRAEYGGIKLCDETLK